MKEKARKLKEKELMVKKLKQKGIEYIDLEKSTDRALLDFVKEERPDVKEMVLESIRKEKNLFFKLDEVSDAYLLSHIKDEIKNGVLSGKLSIQPKVLIEDIDYKKLYDIQIEVDKKDISKVYKEEEKERLEKEGIKYEDLSEMTSKELLNFLGTERIDLGFKLYKEELEKSRYTKLLPDDLVIAFKDKVAKNEGKPGIKFVIQAKELDIKDIDKKEITSFKKDKKTKK